MGGGGGGGGGGGRGAGMGVRNPVETAEVAFATSRAGTSNIVDAIKG